jgi:hypothetical protein
MVRARMRKRASKGTVLAWPLQYNGVVASRLTWRQRRPANSQAPVSSYTEISDQIRRNERDETDLVNEWSDLSGTPACTYGVPGTVKIAFFIIFAQFLPMYLKSCVVSWLHSQYVAPPLVTGLQFDTQMQPCIYSGKMSTLLEFFTSLWTCISGYVWSSG